MSEDPADFLSGGVNFYDYVENSPIGFNDPNGLQTQPVAPCCDEKKIKDGLRQLQQAFAGATAGKSKIFQKYKQCLQGLANDPDVKCGPLFLAVRATNPKNPAKKHAPSSALTAATTCA